MALNATFTADLEQFKRAVRDGVREAHSLDRETGQSIKSVKSHFAGLNSVMGAFGLALSVGAVVQFGRSVLDAAGNIIDLRNKTGLTTDTIQKMQAVADQTGSSIDTFTQAAYKMGITVAEGGKKARDAVKDLGLSMKDLQSASPDEQFRLIVKGLEGIDNQQERNRIGVALFGKQFSEIAASIEDGYSRIADGARKSTETQLEALDAAGDAWTKLKSDVTKATTSILGDMALAITAIDRGVVSTSAWEKAQAFAMTGGVGYVKWLRETGQALQTTDNWLKNVAMSTEKVSTSTRIFTKDTDAAAAALKKEMDALTRAGDEMVRWNDELRKNSEEARRDAIAMDLWKTKFDAAFGVDGDKLVAAAEGLNRLNDAFRASVRDISGGLVPLKGTILENLPDEPEWLSAWAPMREGFKNVLSSLPQTLQNAFTGGGGIMGALKAIGVQIASVLTDSIGDAIANALVKRAVGSAAANVLMPNASGGGGDGPSASSIGKYAAYATVIGAVGIGIFKLVQHNRHLNDEVKKNNAALDELRAGLLESYGGMERLEGIAQALGLSMRAAWGHQGAGGLQAFTDHIKEFEARLVFANDKFAPLLQSAKELGLRLPESLLLSMQGLRDIGVVLGDNAMLLDALAGAAEVDWKKMEEAGARYGDWLKTELGQTFNQLKSNDFSKQLVNDFDLLTRGGASVGSVLFGMREEISKVAQDAKKFGLEIPENMRPWIQNLFDTGNLLDENGDKIDSIADLRFAAPIKTEFEIITGALRDLIDMLGELAGAIRNLPKPDLGLPGMPGGGAGEGGGAPDLGSSAAFSLGGSGGARILQPVQIVVDERVLGEAMLQVVGNRARFLGL